MNMHIIAVLQTDHSALKSGATVRLLEPVRETTDWMAADSFGYVIVVPREKLRLTHKLEVGMRLESERSSTLMDLQDTSRSRPEIAMLAARSYALNRLLAALPDGV